MIEIALGVEPADGKSRSDLTKIKADRAAIIARDVEKFQTKLKLDAEGKTTCIMIEAYQPMWCNTCGSDFLAYPSEAKHCPACTSSDLRELEPGDQRLYDRIMRGTFTPKYRLEAATKRLRTLRAKKTKHPATMTLPEGWVDANGDDFKRSHLGLGADDNYAWYARCGEFEFAGFKTEDDARKGLVEHCKGCAERKDGCQMPDKEPTAVNTDAGLTQPPNIELVDGESWDELDNAIDTPKGYINYFLDDDGYYYKFEPSCGRENDEVYREIGSVRQALDKFCAECIGVDYEDEFEVYLCWKYVAPTPEPDDVRISGITWNKARRTWEVRAMIDGKRTYIHSYDSKKDAIATKAAAETANHEVI